MSFGRGGQGSVPGNADPSQDKTRGKTYQMHAGSDIKGVQIITLLLVLLGVAMTFIADPALRPRGVGGLAAIIVGYVLWRRWERARRPSLDETLSGLGED